MLVNCSKKVCCICVVLKMQRHLCWPLGGRERSNEHKGFTFPLFELLTVQWLQQLSVYISESYGEETQIQVIITCR